MSETAVENVGLNWLNLMGLSIGEEVMILPRAGQPGQGLQGFLVEMVFGSQGPLIVIIRQSEETPLVSVPWDAVLMITRPSGPRVEPEAEPPADISVADLTEMAKAMGLEVPGAIQAIVDQDI